MGNNTSFFEQETNKLTRRNVKKYGLVIDIPDSRDIWVSIPDIKEIKPKVDLRVSNFLPDVYNQGELGSCATHSVMAAYMYDLNKNKVELGFKPSISFVYYNQRYINGTEKFDSGSSIRDTIKVINKIGVCSEEMYPYDTIFFTDRPSAESYTESKKNIRPMLYKRVKPLINDIIKILHYEIPIILGFSVYESFEHADVARTGIVPVPKIGEGIIGCHSALIIGYDTEKKFLVLRNSYGIKFGMSGYFLLPFLYINTRNCSDLWILYSNAPKKQAIKQVIKGPEPPIGPNKVINKDPEPLIGPVIVNKIDPEPPIGQIKDTTFSSPVKIIEKPVQTYKPVKINEQIDKYTQDYIDNIIDSGDDSDSVNYTYKHESE